MSDGSALRIAINGAWQALNQSIERNGFSFTYGQILVLFIAIVIVGLLIHFFA